MDAKHPAQAPTDPVLTPRLVLTPVGPDDVSDLLLLSSDPAVAHWTGPWTGAAVAAWAADMAARWATDGVGKWMARDRSDGSLVGRGGFTRIDLDGEMVLELGWAVRDARTGRGFATELGRAALGWAEQHQPDLPVVAFTEVTTGPRGRSWSGWGCDRRAASDVRASSRAAPACTRTPPSPCTDAQDSAEANRRGSTAAPEGRRSTWCVVLVA